MVHSEEDLESVIKASEIFFGKSTFSDLEEIKEDVFLDIFEDVPSVKISKNEYNRFRMWKYFYNYQDFLNLILKSKDH